MELWLQQIVNLYENNKLNAALAQCIAARTKHNTNPDLLHLQGLIYAKLGQLQNAITAFEQAIKLAPHEAIFHNNISNAYKYAGRIDLAQQHLHEALRLAPNNAEAYNNLGSLYYSQGQIKLAIPQFEKALRLNPNNWEAHYNLANCYIKSDMVTQAITHYKSVLKLNPQHVNANQNLAMAYVSIKNYTEALPYLERAAAANIDHAEWQGHLAEAYLDLGKSENAIRQYELALKLDPDRAEWQHNLAVLYLREKDYPEAQKHLKLSLDLQPENPTAVHMLNALQNTPQPAAPAQYVADLFDQYASYYNKHMREELKYNVPVLLRHAINEFYTASSKTINVLDLGCGTGLCGIYFRDLANFLVGVDISPQMLAQAKVLGAYDGLCRCDILQVIPGYGRPVFDLVLAADVLVYIGDLAPIFAAVTSALRNNGKFAFTVENLNDGDEYKLQTSGRFAHTDEYIQGICRKFSLEILSSTEVTLREQEQVPVIGKLFVSGKF